MKIRETLYDLFSFNRAEQRGVSVLLILLAAVVGLRACLPDHHIMDEVNDKQLFAEVRKFEEELAKARNEAAERKKVQRTTYNRFLPWDDSVKGNRQSQKAGFIIELNSADTLELQRLKGIGSAFARRIAGYRERLGGFVRKEQLMEVFGMDRERYEGIKGNLTLDTSKIRKIDLNQVLFKELMRHPYFPYELTREIILYRKKIRRFENMEQLKDIPLINDSIYMKISSYIDIKI